MARGVGMLGISSPHSKPAAGVDPAACVVVCAEPLAASLAVLALRQIAGDLPCITLHRSPVHAWRGRSRSRARARDRYVDRAQIDTPSTAVNATPDTANVLASCCTTTRYSGRKPES